MAVFVNVGGAVVVGDTVVSGSGDIVGTGSNIRWGTAGACSNVDEGDRGALLSTVAAGSVVGG